MSAPKISVIMAVYNGERYITQSVESILQQSYNDFEFIIIDDGSSDKTATIIANFKERDNRIVFVKNETNIGLTKSLNKGLGIARGAYIARMDADDISFPNRFCLQAKVLQDVPEASLVSGHIEIIDEDGQVVHRPKRSACPLLASWYLLFFNYVGGHSQVMFRRDLALAEGGYAENRPYGQDYELWLRLTRRGDVFIIPEVILQWRRHSDSISSTRRLEQESYSLIDSGKTLSRLLNESLTIFDIVQLHEFWRGHFPDPRYMDRVNGRLKRLYKRFLHERNGSQVVLQSDIQLLGNLISRQFFLWACVLLLQANPLHLFRALMFSALWRIGASRRVPTLDPNSRRVR